MGFMGLCVPKEYGGAGLDFLSYCLLIEELSRADAGVGVTLAVHTSAGTLPILLFGTEEQKAKWVPPRARGGARGGAARRPAAPGRGPRARSCSPLPRRPAPRRRQPAPPAPRGQGVAAARFTHPSGVTPRAPI